MAEEVTEYGILMQNVPRESDWHFRDIFVVNGEQHR
jgi:hypothetical protein